MLQARDKTLKEEIRSQEVETAQLERSLRQQGEQQRARTLGLLGDEQRLCEQSLKQLRETIADLVVSRLGHTFLSIKIIGSEIDGAKTNI